MIEYYQGAFNVNLLFRLSGSAVYRAMIPGLLSVMFSIYLNLGQEQLTEEDDVLFDHPHAIGVLVSSITFLIIFRANNGMSRYWEACSSVFSMMSRWQDACQHFMVYHMQSDHFIGMRPPLYFDHNELNDCFLTRDRERGHIAEDAPKDIQQARAVRKSINYVQDDFKQQQSRRWDNFETQELARENEGTDDIKRGHFMVDSRMDGGWGKLFPNKKTNRPTATFYNPMNSSTNKKGFASTDGGRTPDLYLQELVHLTSLLNAVALSTLRNDVDGSESPLAFYEVGSPWPEVDPEKIQPPIHRGGWMQRLGVMLGADISHAARTKYNAARPLAVMGGVSDAEIRMLQMARGPYAKMTLAWNWVSEFTIREHLSGSTGVVGDALISRAMQFWGNGNSHYNACRKIMFVPFPFPHAQLSVFFILVVIPGIPLLMHQYTNELWIASLLSFLVVSCLAGLHEVARELENPFRKPPNEIPICTLQAQFNEALITAYAGYHPDSYFKSLDARRGKTRENVGMQDNISSAYMTANSVRDTVILESHSEGEEDEEEEDMSNLDAPLNVNETPEPPDDQEIFDLQREIEEHAQKMQQLRRSLDTKVQQKLRAARQQQTPPDSTPHSPLPKQQGKSSLLSRSGEDDIQPEGYHPQL